MNYMELKNNKVIVVPISGKAGNGKDTLATMIKEKLNEKGIEGIVIDRFAKYIKGYCHQMGWDGDKTDYWRSKLQGFTELIKQDLNYKAFHARRICEDIQILNNSFNVRVVLLPDLRFKDELYTVKALFPNDVITVRVQRKNFKSKLTEAQQNHSSETELDNEKFDIYTNHNSLEQLKEIADSIVEEIVKRLN